MSRMTLPLFVALKNLFMVLRKLLAWYAKMDNFLIDTGFTRCDYDPDVYAKKLGIHLIILVPYVDDLILSGTDSKLLNHVKTILKINLKWKTSDFYTIFLALRRYKSMN
jgi:hypothetical protein